MTIRVGPNEPQPTHHIKLTDKDGNSVGLILCNDRGEPQPAYNKTPIERTALKTTTGGGSYADYNYPYSPIVQDDWSGGRGNLDFERDSTRYYDGFGVVTRNPNKLYLSAREMPSRGYRSLDYQWDGPNLTSIGNYLRVFVAANTSPRYYSFTCKTTFTTAYISLFIKVETAAYNLKVEIKDSTGTTVLGSATVSYSYTYEGMLRIPIVANLVAGTQYRLYISESVYSLAWGVMALGYDSYMPADRFLFLLEDAPGTAKKAIYYQYKGQQYKVLNAPSGAPTVWMNGDRGAADSNAGQLTKVIDATKAWTTNQWEACYVKIVQGTGKAESIQYRMITGNDATSLTVDTPWTIQHDTTTEYVIVGSDTWRELTGHGLTVPVTAILPVGDVIYFAQGDSVLMRSHREYNNAGVWTESDWRAEAANYATHLAYQPLANKIWRSLNTDASGNVSVSSATPTAYAADLTFAAAINVGYRYEFINNLEVYPNDSGIEALWVYKEEIAYVVTTQAEAIKLDEMKALRSRDNGKANLVHNVYSYFNLGNGVQRYYGGSIDSVGPNLDEGLPTDRDGKIVKLFGYPGRIFAIVDAGSAGYSSILERSGSGWHEIYRAENVNQPITDAQIQVIDGRYLGDKIWIHTNNISYYINIPKEGESELKQYPYYYRFNGNVILSRMHAGLYDIQKLIKQIKIWTDNTYPLTNGRGGFKGQEIKLDYRLDNDTTWTEITGTAITSPTSTIDLGYGLAGKRIQIRIRLYSYNALETPVLLAAVIDAVSRSQVKYMYNLTYRLIDNEPSLTPRTPDEDSITAAGQSALSKLALLEAWADADTEGLLYMESNSPLYHGKYVFINPPATRQIALDPEPGRTWTGTAYVCSTTAQEA